MEREEITGAIKALDRDRILKTVVYHMKSRERIAEFSQPLLHVDFLDIAAVYSCPLKESGVYSFRVAINNAICERLGISQKELDAAARRNTAADGFSVCTMREIFGELALAPPDVSDIWVASNASNEYGAAVLLYPDFFGRIADQAGGDLYILPSSVHEVLAVPAKENVAEQLSVIVQQVNATEVSESDFLSNSVYRYCRERKEIVMAKTGRKKQAPCLEGHRAEKWISPL